jgi:hypothetical protein
MTRVKSPNMPKPVRTWTRGPSVSAPREELLAWFESTAPRLTRVPVVLRRGQVGFEYRGAMIGALEVHVTDGALGISLAQRAMRGANGDTCTFLVEGVWHGDDAVAPHHYAIREAGFAPATTDELAAITHLEVERGD